VILINIPGTPAAVATSFFLLVVWGLTAISSVSGNMYQEDCLPRVSGLRFHRVGMDPMLGVGRFTFGNVYLMGGSKLNIVY